MRLRGIEMEKTTRRPKRPCIGICYLKKTGKIPKEKDEAEDNEDEEEEEDKRSEDDDYSEEDDEKDL